MVAAREQTIPTTGADGRVISIAMQPFAQGGLRNVYRMTEIALKGKAFVGKESRHEVPYRERLQFHVESSRCQTRAEDYAKKFNKRMKKRKVEGRTNIKVLRAEVYRLNDTDHPGGKRYLGVEEEIKGKYEKYNSNNGFVLDSNTPYCQVAQAFR